MVYHPAPTWIRELNSPLINISEESFQVLLNLRRNYGQKFLSRHRWEVVFALRVSKKLPHLSPAEVHHDWVCRRGLPHCQGSWLPIKEEVSGLTSQSTGESGHWQMLVKQATSTTKYNSYNWEQNIEQQSTSQVLLSIPFIHHVFNKLILSAYYRNQVVNFIGMRNGRNKGPQAEFYFKLLPS